MQAMNWLADQLTWERTLDNLRSRRREVEQRSLLRRLREAKPAEPKVVAA